METRLTSGARCGSMRPPGWPPSTSKTSYPPKSAASSKGSRSSPRRRWSKRYAAALDARADPDFVVIARCDAYAVTGWEDTVRRCRAYIETGADMVFVDGIKTVEDLHSYATDLGDLPPNVQRRLAADP